MKKILPLLFTFIIASPLASCDFGPEEIEVYNVEDLLQECDFDSVKILQGDIDFQGRSLSEKIEGAIDGNGHTISNLNVLTNSIFSGNSFRNLRLSNIHLKTEPTTGASFLTSRNNGIEIDNVHVEDSTLEAVSIANNDLFVGALVGGSLNSGQYHVGATISNSSIRNVTIRCTSPDSGSSRTGNLYVGGLIGSASSLTMTDCSVSDSSIQASSYFRYIEPIVGGIAGLATGEMTRSYVDRSTIISQDTFDQSTVFGVQTGITMVGGFAGGALGETTVSQCFVRDSVIQGDSKGMDFTGGFIGCTASSRFSIRDAFTCTESYVLDSRVESVGGVEGLGSSPRYTGGFVGNIISGGSFSSCFAFLGDLEDSGVYDEGSPNADNKQYVGGFLGGLDDGSVSFCGEMVERMDGQSVDAFGWIDGGEESDVTLSICTPLTVYENGLQMEEVSRSDWRSESVMREKLGLLSLDWSFEGDCPTLPF